MSYRLLIDGKIELVIEDNDADPEVFWNGLELILYNIFVDIKN